LRRRDLDRNLAQIRLFIALLPEKPGPLLNPAQWASTSLIESP
jgi:hypothetical protein